MLFNIIKRLYLHVGCRKKKPEYFEANFIKHLISYFVQVLLRSSQSPPNGEKVTSLAGWCWAGLWVYGNREQASTVPFSELK